MKKGFTLIELLVVISIIAVLSSIILAAVSTARAKSTIAAGQVFEGQMYQAYGANAVAVWSFDDGAGAATAADSSGNRNNLAINSPATIETTTVFRGTSALSVPVTDTTSPATVSLGGSIPFNTANGSISFWINLTAPSHQAGIFCSSGSQSSFSLTEYDFCIVSSDNNTLSSHFIQVLWNEGPSLYSPVIVNSVIGIWTNVAVLWSGSNIRIYINGTQVASSTYTAASLTSPWDFCIGGDCAGDDMVGTLDEMRVYSQSMQTGEIQKMYAEELPHYEHLLASANMHGHK